MEKWEWKGPSTPLGGAIVDSRGLLIVMSTIGDYCSTITCASMAERINIGGETWFKCLWLSVSLGCDHWLYGLDVYNWDVSSGCQ